MTIGGTIKKLRTGQGLTQDQLAEKLYVTRQTVSNWERGTSQPDLEQLETIATALEVDVMTLLYGPQPRYRPSRKQVGIALGMLLLVLVLWVVCWKLGPWCHRLMKHYGSVTPYFFYYYYITLTAVLGGMVVLTLARLKWDLALERRGRCFCWGLGLVLLAYLMLGPVFVLWSGALDVHAQLWVGKLGVFLFWCYERGVTVVQAFLSGALLCLGWGKNRNAQRVIGD